MEELGGGNALTQARGAWLFERIVKTSSAARWAAITPGPPRPIAP